MNERNSVVSRLRALEQRALALRQKADANQNRQDEDDNLWMSSLDIIGELLNVVEQLAVDQSNIDEQMRMACPHCRSWVAVSYDAVADAAARCPACGETVLLSNPT
ncbi:MAG TPA: hypothetical protein GX738_02410 [Firmicutes bacterium]|nr:hypothetical protein [Bacillota bacterium]